MRTRSAPTPPPIDDRATAIRVDPKGACAEAISKAAVVAKDSFAAVSVEFKWRPIPANGATHTPSWQQRCLLSREQEQMSTSRDRSRDLDRQRQSCEAAPTDRCPGLHRAKDVVPPEQGD